MKEKDFDCKYIVYRISEKVTDVIFISEVLSFNRKGNEVEIIDLYCENKDMLSGGKYQKSTFEEWTLIHKSNELPEELMI